MARTARHPISVSPDQGNLFIMSQETGQIYPDLQALPTPTPEQSEYAQNSVVGVMERSVRLRDALVLLGKMSQRTGFTTAAQESRYRPGFHDRYGDNLDDVVAGAVNKRHTMEDQAYGKFSKAYGKAAMVASGMVDEATAKDMTYDAFGEFKQRFADSRNRKRRDAFRSRLTKNEKTITKISKNNQNSPLT